MAGKNVHRVDRPPRSPVGVAGEFLVALSSLLLAAPAGAQNVTWQLNPTGDWNTAGNWTPAAIPTGTATFGATSVPTITFSASTEVGRLRFQSGAPAYSFGLAGQTLTLTGAGIVNNSANAPVFSVTGQSGLLTFRNASAAGNALITSSDLGAVQFLDTSSGDHAVITAELDGRMTFADSSTAGHATLSVGILGSAEFRDDASAGHAIITTDRGLTIFYGDSTAANAVIVTNSDGPGVFDGKTDFRDNSTAGNATITTNGTAFTTFAANATAGTALITTNNHARTTFAGDASAGGATIVTNNHARTIFKGHSTADGATLITQGHARTTFADHASAGFANILNKGHGETIFKDNSTAGEAGITNKRDGRTSFLGNATAGSASIDNRRGGTTSFLGASTAADAVIANIDGFTTFGATSTAGSATIANLGGITLFDDASTAGRAVITNTLSGAVFFGGSSTAANAVITNTGGSETQFSGTSTAGNATISIDAGGFFIFTGSSTAGNATITTSSSITGFIDNSTAGNATITAGLSGATVFIGSSTAGNATVIAANGGATRFVGASTGGQARLIAEAGGVVDLSLLTTAGMTAGSIEGAGNYLLGSKQLTVGSSNLSTTVSGDISGIGGSLVKVGTGTLILSGNSTYTGGTTILGGRIAFNGSYTGDLAINPGGTFSGTGPFNGVIINSGTLAPGNSIGTLTVNGSHTQAAGSHYAVELNSAGQSDKLVVTGAPGTVTIQGGSVDVTAAPGSYVGSKTYTIVTASGGRTGTFDGAALIGNYAFLTPSLSYDANNVFLTIAARFTRGAQTPNQTAVGAALDQANQSPTGDMATVLGVLGGLGPLQGPAAIDGISGVNFAGFGTLSLQSTNAFMNVFGHQAGQGGGGSGHVALAAPSNDACDFSCEVDPRWGAWTGGFGGLGTVAGDGNTHGSTYNLGGAAVGLDYKFDPQFTAGVTLGYSTSTLWTSGLPGQGTSDQVQMGLYGQFTQGAVYVDGLVGYAHGQNRMTRPIAIPGLAARTAQGSTSVEQFFGLVESGYKVDVGTTANAFVTPFARLQGSTATQAAFSETGADSLNLNVASQTTSSLRTVLGAQVGATVAKVDVKLQAGWSHELADTSRPVTASFAGAPAFAFTTQGATAPRDGAVVGAMAAAKIDEHTSLYGRYDGDLEGGTTSHTFFAGVRMTW